MRRLRFVLAVAGLLLLTPPLRAVPLEKVPAPAAESAAAPAGVQPAAPASAEHLPLKADGLLGDRIPISNSMVVCWIVALGLIVFAQVATRRMEAVPSGAQNLWEWMVEELYNFLETILGPRLVKRTFWFLATIFLFILFTNWFGLVPGVGSIGWGVPGRYGFEITRPLLRGGNADLNMPFAMAMLFFLFWTIWALQANGLKGFVLHIFGPKGDLPGVIGLVMILIFVAVGCLEAISIFFRPIALTFRLFGNMFAGENLLEAMRGLIQHPAWARAVFSTVLPVPFYFMELLVGFVQSLVFMLLCAVFTAVICVHDEEPAKAH